MKTLGLGETMTLVLTCPPYLIAGGISIYWSWQSGKFNERTWYVEDDLKVLSQEARLTHIYIGTLPLPRQLLFLDSSSVVRHSTQAHGTVSSLILTNMSYACKYLGG